MHIVQVVSHMSKQFKNWPIKYHFGWLSWPAKIHIKYCTLHDYNQNESCYIVDVNTHSHMWFTTSHDYRYTIWVFRFNK